MIVRLINVYIADRLCALTGHRFELFFSRIEQWCDRHEKVRES